MAIFFRPGGEGEKGSVRGKVVKMQVMSESKLKYW